MPDLYPATFYKRLAGKTTKKGIAIYPKTCYTYRNLAAPATNGETAKRVHLLEKPLATGVEKRKPTQFGTQHGQIKNNRRNP